MNEVAPEKNAPVKTEPPPSEFPTENVLPKKEGSPSKIGIGEAGPSDSPVSDTKKNGISEEPLTNKSEAVAPASPELKRGEQPQNKILGSSLTGDATGKTSPTNDPSSASDGDEPAKSPTPTSESFDSGVGTDSPPKDSPELPPKKESPAKAKKNSLETLNALFFRLSLKDKMLFARHMEMMTRSGLQVLEALEILRKQTQKAAFITVLDHLIADVKNGHYLSVAMERYQKIFGDFIINLIRVGETSGTLSDNFKYLAEEIEKKSELRKKVVGALIYPIVILVATVGITGIMVFLIFPRILPVLRSLNVELPLATRVFVALSQFVINNGLFLILGLFALGIGWTLLLRIRAFRLGWNQILLRLPLLGPLVTDVNIITVSRTMNLLLKGGVHIVEALEITGKSLNNPVYQGQIEEVGRSVQRGERMSKLMLERPRLFPATFAEMSNVGETTGKLGETLEFLSVFYESELDSTTKTLSNVLEPLLLLMMGLIVSFIAISIVTPIYKISQSLGR